LTCPTIICNNTGQGTVCGTGNGSNHDWNNDVGPYLEGQNNLAPFLRDLQNCNLAQVTWVTPDGRWGDHLTQNKGLGPDCVADIVNLVGNSRCPTPQVNWSNTVILIVWDDAPWNIGYSNSGNNNGIQYVYGFRVPLLVVSTFAKQHFISGSKANHINYDFGSILKFIEETFLPSNTFINPVYPYADQFVSVGVNDLSDFFDCFTQACRHPFQPITLVNNSQYCKPSLCGSNQCDAAC
jgi:phospholipase C